MFPNVLELFPSFSLPFTLFPQIGSAFKIADLSRWHIIVIGPDKIDEMRSAPDDALSFTRAMEEVCSHLCL